ncbi:hypothetical protein [Actinomadura xylanilytica]|uniref:hypothetical protein n=1 Tax=Actinomadura xylanilytica TaxID=887459 RepID=UPI00255AB917|nr:hypothetical protein [Actinomadura xylanilytica]MDL4777872.1 hypothetical protein [Actinomadura xylanilytica]
MTAAFEDDQQQGGAPQTTPPPDGGERVQEHPQDAPRGEREDEGQDEGERGAPAGQWVLGGMSGLTITGAMLWQTVGVVGAAAVGLVAAGGAVLYVGRKFRKSSGSAGTGSTGSRIVSATRRVTGGGGGGVLGGKGRAAGRSSSRMPGLGKFGGGAGRTGGGKGRSGGRAGGRGAGGNGAGGGSGKRVWPGGAKAGTGSGGVGAGARGAARSAQTAARTAARSATGKAAGKVRETRAGRRAARAAQAATTAAGAAKTSGKTSGKSGGKTGAKGGGKAGAEEGVEGRRARWGGRMRRWNAARSAAAGVVGGRSSNRWVRLGAHLIGAVIALFTMWRTRRARTRAAAGEQGQENQQENKDSGAGATAGPGGAAQRAGSPVRDRSTHTNSSTTRRYAMDAGFPIAVAAAEVNTAAAGYAPENMWVIGTDLRQLPDVFANVGLALRTWTQRLEGDYPINPQVVEQIGQLYVGLGQLAVAAQEIEPLYRTLHANDLAREEAPRTNERAWNV